jgi:Fur family transcriptional regulator, ferric uptake regulator
MPPATQKSARRAKSARSAEIASPVAERWIALAEDSLRRAGHRSSLPRSAVMELIAGQDCVLTAHEIAAELRRRRRGVGIATVYRTLELLEELHLVQRLDFGGGSARYEPALPGGEDHHHHLVCDRCGRVTPFEDPGLERAIESLAGRLEYRVGDHDVVLKGSCPDCVTAGT